MAVFSNGMQTITTSGVAMLPTQFPAVREPTIPEKIAEARSYILQAHQVLDRLEGVGVPNQATVSPESLLGVSNDASQMAATLLSRLRSLFGE